MPFEKSAPCSANVPNAVARCRTFSLGIYSVMRHIRVPAVLKYLLMIDVISLQPIFTVMRFALVDITSVFTPSNETTLVFMP